jgi:hypothetical protein
MSAFSPASLDHAPAQTAPSGTALISSSGTPGSFTANYKVGRCRYSSVGGSWLTEIELPAPTVTPIAGQPNQRITWEPRLYQARSVLPNLQLLQSAPEQSTAVTGGAITFAQAELTGMPQGPAYVAGGLITWYSNDTVLGSLAFFFTTHDSFDQLNRRTTSAHCVPIAAPEIILSTYRTTVNVTVQMSGRYFPLAAPVDVTWNGKVIAQTMSDANGLVSTSVRVPAAPLGDYRLGFNAGTLWAPHEVLTVLPRIKVIPGEAGRGAVVKISLRGFGKKEVVRIRWKRDGGWVEVGRVTTSNTGSGELWVPVPVWVPDGSTSVRGDAPIARAQTNAVFVSGGSPLLLANEEPTPTSEAVLPATPEPAIDPNPATPAASTATPTITETPTGEGTPFPDETMVPPEPTNVDEETDTTDP